MLTRIFARYQGEQIPPGRVAVFAVLLVAALMAAFMLVMSETTPGATLQP